MTEKKFRCCDNPGCKAIIPEENYYINTADIAVLCDTEDANATVGAGKDFCSAKCLYDTLMVIGTELEADICCPLSCPGRGPEADTCIDCVVNKKGKKKPKA